MAPDETPFSFLDSLPDETLFSFLDGLSDDIKEGILFQVCWGMGIRDFLELARRDYINQLRGMLEDEKPKDRPYKCAQIVGVLELVLQPHEMDLEQFNLRIYEETGFRAFRDVALRQPLAQQQCEDALEEFRKLRKDALSPQALHMWQTLLRESSEP